MPQDTSKHAIIGTAGHVDHGKTTLIKALTGVDTDRLKEEKERGMTIDLGFAPLVLPGGIRVGIVDVPGHERFLKNMLAGATGIDVILLVIAADEGIMPQTREHLDILQLLEAGKGVVALSKCDLVDKDWLDLVEEDIRQALKNTFLNTAKIIRVSAVTGTGVKELAEELARLVDEAEHKNSSGPFRIPVDRVFTIQGFGTVITGTLVSGTIRAGDPVEILPQKVQTRIRNIEVHEVRQQEACAGTRVAVNLAGVEVDDLHRGDVLVPPGYLRPSMRVDALVRLLPSSPWPLKNRLRIRLHTGSAEHLGRIAILGNTEIAAGEEGYIQFHSESPIVAARGDRFVIRSYSPMHTIGGGIILDPNATRHKISDKRVLEILENRRQGEPLTLLEDALLASPGPVLSKDAAVRIGLPEEAIKPLALKLKDDNRVMMLEGYRIIHPAVFNTLSFLIMGALEEYHKTNPLKAGMSKEDLRASAGRGMDNKSFGAVLMEMERQGMILTSENLIKLPKHKVKLTDVEEKALKEINELFMKSAFNPPTLDDAAEKGGERGREVLEYMIDTRLLIKIDDGIYMHPEAIAKAERMLIERLSDGGKITVSEFRDMTGSSRRYAVPLLQYFDDRRLTRREGDERVLARR